MSFCQRETLPSFSFQCTLQHTQLSNKQCSSSLLVLYYLHGMWICYHVPSLPLFSLWAVKETSLQVLLLCCGLPSLTSQGSHAFSLSSQKSADYMQFD